MNILITGGAGYIGSHTSRQFLEETDHHITILDNLSTSHQKTIDTLKNITQDAHKKLKFIKADLNDTLVIDKILCESHFDAVIHFAASIVVPESITNPLKYYQNNSVNTINLINLCLKYNINNFIFSSTAAVYGEPTQIPVTENTPLNPINPYGFSKMMSERVLQDAANAHKAFNYVILRYFNVAGADTHSRIGQSFPEATHLIKIASQCVTSQREKMSIYGEDYPTPDGTCIRDYIHVDDLASAHLKALEFLNSGEKIDSPSIFNVGYGRGFSVKEVIDTIKKTSETDFIVDISQRREGDPAILISDNSKIKRHLNWSFKYDDLSAICQSAVAWERKLIDENSH